MATSDWEFNGELIIGDTTYCKTSFQKSLNTGQGKENLKNDQPSLFSRDNYDSLVVIKEEVTDMETVALEKEETLVIQVI